MSRQIVFVREKYPCEFRTMIVPNEVPYYTEKGFEVFVELGIGEKIGFAEPAGCPKAPACLVRRPTESRSRTADLHRRKCAAEARKEFSMS